MIPTAFDQDNAVLAAPEGAVDVVALSVHLGAVVSPTGDTQPIVISCYKVTDEELAEITRTRRVWLTVLGKTMPPVRLDGVSPFDIQHRLEAAATDPRPEDISAELKRSRALTLIGVLSPFTCGICRQLQEPRRLAGGVYFRWKDQPAHSLVCQTCRDNVLGG